MRAARSQPRLLRRPYSAANFIKVAQQGELAPGQVKSVAVNGTQIALCNVDGVYYAIDDTCPHRSALAV